MGKVKQWEELTPEGQKAAYLAACAEVDAAKTVTEGLKADVEALTAINEELQAENVKMATQTSSKFPVVTFDKKTYEIIIPSFILSGKKLQAKDIKDDSEELEKLINMEFSGLRLVETENQGK